ncbi:uncharacterized protein LOC122066848 [Macadamia integrifolia]|uniref:uncharacterized protein LOC122066848 n=1 Tax=Macadamia integrifolia TaxID=60698 RepID=UPI001C4F9D94|nr:uncharacterized protein LOC122066848 [Macadamia integrifolia]
MEMEMGKETKEMVVAGFRRSLSISTSSPRRPPPPEKSHHTRSISLPCNSHPLISQLKDRINKLRSWESEAAATRPSSASLCDGLTHLKKVHDCFDDLLHLSQTQDSLRHRSDWVEKLLEDFLRFVDVYGIFRASLVALKEEHLAAQVAIRRRDESKMASYVKALKTMDKEMRKLASVVRGIGKCSSSALAFVSNGDAELAAILRDVKEVTVTVSVALFHGLSSSSLSAKSWMVVGWRLLSKTQEKTKEEKGIRELEEAGKQSLRCLRKKGDEEVRIALEKLQALEDCIGGIESGNERVFRSLMNTRVSLLNILTQ